MTEFKVKDIDISSGGILIAIINHDDATNLDLHHGDRVGLIKGNKHVHVIINIAESDKAIPKGQIGLFEEVLDLLKVRSGQIIKLVNEGKPISVHYIKEKLNGKELNYKEIKEIVQDIVSGKLSDVEITYFVSASYINGLTERETVHLTKAMIETGDVLKLKNEIVVDKHCTGGVAGNRTTMLIVPIIAAAGIKIPKTSSRAITSPAGTADTMEVLSKVEFPLQKMERIVKKANGCIVWGGAINLAPADDKIIRVESPLRIDAEGQLLASILAKKGSVSSTHVLIDIPVGGQTKISSRKQGISLGKKFVKIGSKIGMKIEYIITNGDEPIGNGIGPSLEAKDVLKVLQRSDTRPLDLEKKSVMMSGKIFEMAGKCKKGKGAKMAQEILDSGKALDKMLEIIKMQGGKKIHSSDLPVAKLAYDYLAKKSGKVKDINNHVISQIARFAGAPLDHDAGLYLYVHEGEKVIKGDKLLTIHAENEDKLNFAKKVLFSGKAIQLK